MTSLEAACLIFICVFGGAIIGVLLKRSLPEYHRDVDTKDVVKLVMSLLSTMAALVLSLLIVAAHTFYDVQQSEIQRLGVNIVLLEEVLLRYGPETQPAREALARDVTGMALDVSPVEGVGVSRLMDSNGIRSGGDFFGELQKLNPHTDAQRFDETTAASLATSIASTRLLIHDQVHSAVPVPLILVLVAWLTILFIGFGIFAPLNGTVVVALFVGAASVAAAVFLILEMSHPFGGLLSISSSPILNALAQIK
jgi:hypothetical protein